MQSSLLIILVWALGLFVPKLMAFKTLDMFPTLSYGQSINLGWLDKGFGSYRGRRTTYLGSRWADLRRLVRPWGWKRIVLLFVSNFKLL